VQWELKLKWVKNYHLPYVALCFVMIDVPGREELKNKHHQKQHSFVIYLKQEEKEAAY
jgi:hypothetical protein